MIQNLTESDPTMVAIVKTNQQLAKVLEMPGEPHIVLHNRSAGKIVENLKESSCTNSSSRNNNNGNGNINKNKVNNTIHTITTQKNPLVNDAMSKNDNNNVVTGGVTGGNPQPKKRSMKRKKPKKKGAAARKTQMKIKQKKTRNKIKKQMRKTKRKR